MKRRLTAGYTIIEVIIVLTVTTALFVAVSISLSGKQATTEFSQALRDYEAKIQTVASDVATGYYQKGSFNCIGAITGTPVTFSPLGPINNSGSNKGCLFLGKIMTTNADTTDIFTVAGRQFKTDDTSGDVTTIAEAKPQAVFNGFVDITQRYTHKFSIRIKNVYDIATGLSVGGYGFMSELTGGAGARNPDTGSRGVFLYALNGTNSPNVNPRVANAALINVNTNLVPALDGIRICLWDGGSHRGEITVGANTSHTATNVFVDNGISVVCQNA